MKAICQTGSFASFSMYNAIYVDKTELIYSLVSLPSRIFIFRPRRFCKSLTLDTIATLFERSESSQIFSFPYNNFIALF